MSYKKTSTAMVDGLTIESNKTEVLLIVKLNQELKFDEHVN